MEYSKEYLAAKAATQPKLDGARQRSRKPLVGRKVKHVFIEAAFPELPYVEMNQFAHGEASGTKPAIARAFRELLKKVPGKRVSVIKATISITTKIVEG